MTLNIHVQGTNLLLIMLMIILFENIQMSVLNYSNSMWTLLNSSGKLLTCQGTKKKMVSEIK